MRITSILAIILVCLWSGPAARSQTNDKQRAMDILHGIVSKYKTKAGTRFSVTYRYAAESSPAAFLDSLKGDYEMMGENYRYRIDSTEIISNPGMTLIVFHEDHTIYLAKSVPHQQAASPLTLMDSMLFRNDSASFQVTETAATQTITILLPANASVKRIEYVIDRKSGQIQKMLNVVPAAALYDPSVRSLLSNKHTYAIVEADFSDYQEGSGDTGRLDVYHYFKKQGAGFVALPPFSSYSIISGNAGL